MIEGSMKLARQNPLQIYKVPHLLFKFTRYLTDQDRPALATDRELKAERRPSICPTTSLQA